MYYPLMFFSLTYLDPFCQFLLSCITLSVIKLLTDIKSQNTSQNFVFQNVLLKEPKIKW